jgi:hypothetical protein
VSTSDRVASSNTFVSATRRAPQAPRHVQTFGGRVELLGEHPVALLAFAHEARDARALAAKPEEHLGAQRARADPDQAPGVDHMVEDVRPDPVRRVRDEAVSAVGIILADRVNDPEVPQRSVSERS